MPFRTLSYPQSEQQARNKIMKRSCVAEREREREREGRERKGESYHKGLGYVNVESFLSKIYRASWQDGNSGKS